MAVPKRRSSMGHGALEKPLRDRGHGGAPAPLPSEYARDEKSGLLLPKAALPSPPPPRDRKAEGQGEVLASQSAFYRNLQRDLRRHEAGLPAARREAPAVHVTDEQAQTLGLPVPEVQRFTRPRAVGEMGPDTIRVTNVEPGLVGREQAEAYRKYRAIDNAARTSGARSIPGGNTLAYQASPNAQEAYIARREAAKEQLGLHRRMEASHGTAAANATLPVSPAKLYPNPMNAEQVRANEQDLADRQRIQLERIRAISGQGGFEPPLPDASKAYVVTPGPEKVPRQQTAEEGGVKRTRKKQLLPGEDYPEEV